MSTWICFVPWHMPVFGHNTFDNYDFKSVTELINYQQPIDIQIFMKPNVIGGIFCWLNVSTYFKKPCILWISLYTWNKKMNSHLRYICKWTFSYELMYFVLLWKDMDMFLASSSMQLHFYLKKNFQIQELEKSNRRMWNIWPT